MTLIDLQNSRIVQVIIAKKFACCIENESLRQQYYKENISKLAWGKNTDLRLTFIDLWWPQKNVLENNDVKQKKTDHWRIC